MRRCDKIKIRFALTAVLALGFTAAARAEPSAGKPDKTGVYVSGEGGYNTYRIPALVVAPDGTVLAFCEGRKNSSRDYGNIDLVLKRSSDGGRTWSEITIIQDFGGDEPVTAGNPCPIVDRRTGAVHLLYCRDNHDCFYVRSEDNGQTWSEPREITDVFDGFDYDRVRLATGPVHGIQMSDGRLIAPVWLSNRSRERKNENTTKRRFRSGVIYSDDHGRTWHAGELIPATINRLNEATAYEATDGSLMLNIRTHKVGYRAVARSTDGGETWSEPQLDKSLPSPTCQGSTLRYSGGPRPGANRLLFSNPASKQGRHKLTVRLSRDDGESWPVARVLHKGPAAYSDLARTEGGTILCLYESGERSYHEGITCARFPLGWLTGDGP